MAVTQQGTGARKRPRFAFAATLAAAATALALAAPAVQARPAAGRVMPPEGLACDPNQLTSYFGKVTGYKRGKTRTWLRIATDYDTIEEVVVPHDGAKDASKHFLYQRRPFTAKDWTRIETRAGVLRAGTRATAWVCADGRTPPRIDWNAATE